jgi:hypothetical protein
MDELVTLLEALRHAFGHERFTAADALMRAGQNEPLKQALDVGAGDRKTGKATVRSLAYALRGATNRPVEDLILRADSGKRPRRCWIERKGR